MKIPIYIPTQEDHEAMSPFLQECLSKNKECFFKYLEKIKPETEKDKSGMSELFIILYMAEIIFNQTFYHVISDMINTDQDKKEYLYFKELKNTLLRILDKDMSRAIEAIKEERSKH